jgi:2'-5' RNA ligase
MQAGFWLGLSRMLQRIAGPVMPASSEPTVRVFFALVPPPALQRALAALGRDMARRAHGRPVPAENVHATLAFIGSWPVERLAVLDDAAAAVQGDPMRLVLDTQGGFRRAGVAWVAPSVPPRALDALAASLTQRLKAAGVGLDERPLHAHVTLARRCRGPFPSGAIDPLPWDVDALALMQSDTRAEGARYRCLARWALPRRLRAP